MPLDTLFRNWTDFLLMLPRDTGKTVKLLSRPDHVCQVISWVGVLVIFWFPIHRQGVIVIPAMIQSIVPLFFAAKGSHQKNLSSSSLYWLHPDLELPTSPDQKCQPFGTWPKPPPAFLPYCRIQDNEKLHNPIFFVNISKYLANWISPSQVCANTVPGGTPWAHQST